MVLCTVLEKIPQSQISIAALEEPEYGPLILCILGAMLSPPQCQFCLGRHLALSSLIPGISRRNSPIELFCYVFLWTSETNLILCALSRAWDPGFLRKRNQINVLTQPNKITPCCSLGHAVLSREAEAKRAPLCLLETL